HGHHHHHHHHDYDIPTTLEVLFQGPGTKLNESHRLHQFFRDMDDEESWIKEKKLLVSSEDYGRDLTGVQNLRKKHKRLEAELAAHEPAIQGVLDTGKKLSDDNTIGKEEIQQRLAQFVDHWKELKQLAAARGQRLESGSGSGSGGPNILHISVTSKWFNIDNKIVDHRP
uniref:spectrin n=1 Tax=Escherichia coli TaxID=562 RepID=UPI00094DFD60|nr:Chain A, spectrin [Escherichia coli]